MAVKFFDIVVTGVDADAQCSGDLFFAESDDKEIHHLMQPWGQLLPIGLLERLQPADVDKMVYLLLKEFCNLKLSVGKGLIADMPPKVHHQPPARIGGTSRQNTLIGSGTDKEVIIVHRIIPVGVAYQLLAEPGGNRGFNSDPLRHAWIAVKGSALKIFAYDLPCGGIL